MMQITRVQWKCLLLVCFPLSTVDKRLLIILKLLRNVLFRSRWLLDHVQLLMMEKVICSFTICSVIEDDQNVGNVDNNVQFLSSSDANISPHVVIN